MNQLDRYTWSHLCHSVPSPSPTHFLQSSFFSSRFSFSRHFITNSFSSSSSLHIPVVFISGMMASLFPATPPAIRLPSRKGKHHVAAGTERDSSSTYPAANANTSLKKVNGVRVVRGGVDEDEKKVVEKDGVREMRRKKRVDEFPLPVLYDDGFGTASVKDYLDYSKEIGKADGGPPRWFCPVECGKPIDGAPLLLFLPGVDGTGMGLILHHKALGKFFEVRCLHIPIMDRTPFEGLIRYVEETVRYEYAQSQNRPIYIVGDSFGGCLAISVAARNPTIDLVLILANPATSFGKSQLQPYIPILEAVPDELHFMVPYLLSFTMGEPVKLAMANISKGLSPVDTLNRLSEALTSLLPHLSDLSDILPKEALLWKIKLLQSAAFYANSRLHAITAEVAVLTSGNDRLLPSKDEGARLKSLLKNCRVRHFKDNGHTLLMEDGINLMTVIKALKLYRRSRRRDYVTDFLPPSLTEVQKIFEQDNRLFRVATSPVILSTLENGNIVRGLSGVPDKGPVLLVGYHMLMGLELQPLYYQFLREKKICLRGMGHPTLFRAVAEGPEQDISFVDLVALFGGLPVSPTSMYKLLSRDAFVLLYPGGAREALHRKGEEYKLFWPDKPEFVRMAAQLDVTIVPFGAVGEDDMAEIVLDYNDLKDIPVMKDFIRDINKDIVNLRSDMTGEISEQDIHFPLLRPKIPGRLYYLFGKPIEARELKETLKDRSNANALYFQIKSEVEKSIAYLKKKREEDTYRGIIERTIYQASWGSESDVPFFEP